MFLSDVSRFDRSAAVISRDLRQRGFMKMIANSVINKAILGLVLIEKPKAWNWATAMA